MEAIIERHNADFSLSTVRANAAWVEFKSTEFWADGALDVAAAPAAIQRHHKAAVIYPAFQTSKATKFAPARTYLRVDHNTGSLWVRANELSDVLAWFDAVFPDWRTKRGAYSKFAFHAVDYTADEIQALITREKFWGGFDDFLENGGKN
jgi:hypothetical protein